MIALWSVRCSYKKGAGKQSLLYSQVLERESLLPKSGPCVSCTEGTVSAERLEAERAQGPVGKQLYWESGWSRREKAQGDCFGAFDSSYVMVRGVQRGEPWQGPAFPHSCPWSLGLDAHNMCKGTLKQQDAKHEGLTFYRTGTKTT